MSQPENIESPIILLRRLHRWRMAFFGLIILIAGLTTGAAATLLVLHWTGPEPVPPPDQAYIMMMERIVPRLGLSPEQAEQVGPILRRHMQRLDEIRAEGREQIAQELQGMNAELSDVLDAEQQQHWQGLLRGLPGDFPRGPGGRRGLGPQGPQGPFGPRGGGRGGMRRGMPGPPLSAEPNIAPQR